MLTWTITIVHLSFCTRLPRLKTNLIESFWIRVGGSTSLDLKLKPSIALKPGGTPLGCGFFGISLNLPTLPAGLSATTPTMKPLPSLIANFTLAVPPWKIRAGFGTHETVNLSFSSSSSSSSPPSKMIGRGLPMK